MPCYTMSTVGVVLKVADLDMLQKALEREGEIVRKIGNRLEWSGGQSFNKDTSELRVRDASMAAKLKQAYGAEIVRTQAKRYGWQLKEVAPYKFEVLKR